MRWRRAFRNRHTGGGCKTLIGALGKSRGAERIRKGEKNRQLRVDDGRNLSETCLLDGWLLVLRLQECDNRLIKGTGESCHAMLNEKCKLTYLRA